MSKRAEVLWHDFGHLRRKPENVGTAFHNVVFTVQADELSAARELAAHGYVEERGNNVGGWNFWLTSVGADDLATLAELPEDSAKDSFVEMPDP